MSIHHRFPEEAMAVTATYITAVVEELDKAQRLLDLTQHEGWEVLNEELTRRELMAMQQLASGSTDPNDIAFNRAVAQVCKYIRDLPGRMEIERDTRRAELDMVAPKEVQDGRR